MRGIRRPTLVIHLGLLVPALAIGMAFCLPVSPAIAQIKYNPNHPEVEKIVNRALTALKTMKSGTSAGHLVLRALTVVEASKRYQAIVPSDNPRVQEALKRIKIDIKAEKFSLYSNLEENELYYPSLAVILLCDLGARKHKEEIETIVDFLVQRQKPGGGFTYRRHREVTDGDTSQTQFVCLALWVAHRNGFIIDEQVATRALDWLLETNLTQGNWNYLYNNLNPVPSSATLSIHMAALSSVYLLADFLNLSPRRKQDSDLDSELASISLPPSVEIYNPAKAKALGAGRQTKSVSKGKMTNVQRRGNQYLSSNFRLQLAANTHYYLFAFERYAYFREGAENSVKQIPDWYDQGVEFLQNEQLETGAFPSNGTIENSFFSTCFSVLFLVRATQTLVPPSGFSNLNGGEGLRENVRLDLVNGQVKSFDVIRGLDDVLQLLDNDDIDEQQFEFIQASLAKSVAQFLGDESQTRRQQINYMRSLVSNRNYFKRLIAIKLLSRQQDMDNVPALIYALGDPDLRICKEAHNGLRLISRKLDTIQISDNPSHAEFQKIKNQWTAWFLKIRPGAELLD